MKVIIPDYVSEAVLKSISTKGRYSSNVLYKRDKSGRIKDWFETNDIPPSFVYTVLSSGKTEFERPVCAVCGKPLTKVQIRTSVTHCSAKCSGIDPERTLKREQTTLQRYGVRSTNQLESVKKKKIATSLKHYGTESPMQCDSVKQTLKESMLEKYGVENPSYNKESVQKRKETSLLHYGVTCPLIAESVIEKTKNTLKEKYKVEHPSQSQEIKEKKRETLRSHYGVDHPTHSPELLAKILDTKRKRYGDDLSGISSSIAKTRRENYYETFKLLLNEKFLTLLSTKEEYVENKCIKVKCQHCGTEFSVDQILPAQKVICPKCKVEHISEGEREVSAFVETLLDPSLVIRNDRSVLDGKELDIYIPSKNLAIEYDGDYFHSTKHGKYKTYHFEKSKKCQDIGIRLIHVFEWEWNTKREKVKNLIKSALGLYDRRIYARQCSIKEISNADYTKFLDLYHMNGSVNSSIRYGLDYDGELVSVIGFGKSRFSKDEMELHRYCIKSGVMIVGGFAKLLSKIDFDFMTFVDFSHFSGSSYLRNGFEFESYTPPNYCWIRYTEIYSRYQAQKHKLSGLLENFDPSLSESQNMEQNGFCKVYDSGNLKFQYKTSKTKGALP